MGGGSRSDLDFRHDGTHFWWVLERDHCSFPTLCINLECFNEEKLLVETGLELFSYETVEREGKAYIPPSA
jgi:hypothetical protein